MSLRDLDYLDVAGAIRAGRANRDIVVGIKVRMTELIIGTNGIAPLQRAVEAADALGLPVMVHIGGSDVTIGQILDILRSGDIITHCYTDNGNGIVQDGRLSDEAIAARARGIVFDVGHGFSSFSFPVAEVCAEAGFWPDVISTDVHSLSSSSAMVDLPTTMSKLLNLGMPLADVLAAVTSRPAAVLGRAEVIGSLALGREADVTVLEVVDAPFETGDGFGNRRTLARRISVRSTVRAGLPWTGPFPHPGVSYNGPRAVG